MSEILSGQNDPRYKKLVKLMDNWGFSRTAFAKKVGINQFTFRFKLADKYPYKFSEADYALIERGITKLKDELDKY